VSLPTLLEATTIEIDGIRSITSPVTTAYRGEDRHVVCARSAHEGRRRQRGGLMESRERLFYETVVD
jgi:hypothetical protein